MTESKPLGLIFVSPLVKNTNYLVETSDGITETFIELIIGVVDYNIVRAIGTKNYNYLYVTKNPDTYDECKNHMTHAIWQVKMQLEKYNFTDFMDSSVTEYQGYFWSDEFEKCVTGNVIPPTKVKKYNNKEKINRYLRNHSNINGKNQNTTQLKLGGNEHGKVQENPMYSDCK